MFLKVMKFVTVLSFVCWGCHVWAAQGRLTILHTDNLNGRFQLMMKVGALKNQIQHKTGAIVLLDAGNAYSTREMAFEHTEGRVSPTVDMMSRAGYDAWVLGANETQTDPNFLN